ncbi:rhodanese-related sulfurtransferase [Aquimarina sp. EL_43]|uniref:rhodanese-like domain-containing protein n=1 Tax=unclassified Aquimarina TaxID=2627091 RepID=UPI001A2A1DCA|nr:rhodanese-like domain-containing protein [Aquimarina sp. EL_35]MBG6133361.1 rhodanese-related sulfurtransferase [Aquimarina sp. EL_35]MBG6153460.1 rhodanese-related sulfurtransferase [Aquimarina sp. EL_32]MBG6171616.1 rhodanese-related sulfurtransferase [Aquimarina sp. EL_43]
MMSIFKTLFKIQNQQTDAITKIDALAFKEAISQKKDLQLVDVRTSYEYNTKHINGAINIDFFKQTTFKSSFNKFDKDEPLYVYCRSGNRSKKAAVLLAKTGFKNIIDLKGGYIAWEKCKN